MVIPSTQKIYKQCIKEGLLDIFVDAGCAVNTPVSYTHLVISASVFVFAKQLLLIFVQPYETEILAVGIQYLRIEGVFYFGIGFLFLFYGYYRAVRKPGMSVVLTVISLGTRVVLAYVLSAVPQIGVSGIWSAVPIGWILADIAGWIYYKKLQQR